MKKTLEFLTIFFLTFAFVACGGGSSSGGSGSNDPTPSEREREAQREREREAQRERERENLRESGHELVPVERVTIVQNADGVSARIEGYLPDSCYGPPQDKLDRDENSFFVDVYSRVSGDFCAEVTEEFEITVDLGELSSGDYEVIVQEFTRWETRETFRVD